MSAGEGGVYRAASDETEWKAVNAGLPGDKDVRSMAATSAYVFVGTNHGIYASGNDGESWTSINGDIPNTVWIPKICVAGTTLFLATNTGASYRGTPEGAGYAWIERMLRFPSAVVSKGRFLFSASLGYPSPKGLIIAVNRSEDNGLTWAPSDSGLPHTRLIQFNDMASIGNSLFVGLMATVMPDTGITPVYRSDDDGISWKPWGMGLPRTVPLKSLAVCGNALYALTQTGLWTLSVPVTAARPNRTGSAPVERSLRHRPALGNIWVPNGSASLVPKGEYRATGRRLPVPPVSSSRIP